MIVENSGNTKLFCRLRAEARAQFCERGDTATGDLHEICEMRELAHHTRADHADPDDVCHHVVLEFRLLDGLGRHVSLAQELREYVHHRLMNVFDDAVIFRGDVNGRVGYGRRATTRKTHQGNCWNVILSLPIAPRARYFRNCRMQLMVIRRSPGRAIVLS